MQELIKNYKNEILMAKDAAEKFKHIPVAYNTAIARQTTYERVVSDLEERIKEPMFFLWFGDSYVDLDGSVDDDFVEGVFSSISEVNKYISEKWFECTFDTRNMAFANKDTRLSDNKTKYCYLELRTLNCA